jgi:hypothetical protein
MIIQEISNKNSLPKIVVDPQSKRLKSPEKARNSLYILDQ